MKNADLVFIIFVIKELRWIFELTFYTLDKSAFFTLWAQPLWHICFVGRLLQYVYTASCLPP
ncbi:MAG: hypothetical protein ACOCZS_01335, partial [Verrucomicrobiota bacterium]